MDNYRICRTDNLVRRRKDGQDCPSYDSYFRVHPKSMTSVRRADCARQDQRSSRRSGAILAAALVCLAVVILIGSSLITTVLRQHRQQEQEQAVLQAFWLAESGVQRAADRLAAARDYVGETWQVDDAALHGQSPGVVVIRVESTKDDETSRQIIVEAQCGPDPLQRVVQRRAIAIQSPTSGESS